MNARAAGPAEIRIMAQCVRDYCAEQGITDADARDEVACRVLDLFHRGVTDPEGLARELRAEFGPRR